MRFRKVGGLVAGVIMLWSGASAAQGITEADLSGHLNNANGKAKTARAKASALLAEDNQLYEAVALLKGLNILGMRDKKPEPATNGES